MGAVPWPSGSGLEEGTGSQRPQWRGDLLGALCAKYHIRPLNLWYLIQSS